MKHLLCTLLIALLLAWPAAAATAENEPLVDLNSAPASVLVKLPGIGPRRAEEIIRYRLVHGFRRKLDLLRVKGIGRRIYARLKPLVEVRPIQRPRAEEVKVEVPPLVVRPRTPDPEKR